MSRRDLLRASAGAAAVAVPMSVLSSEVAGAVRAATDAATPPAPPTPPARRAPTAPGLDLGRSRHVQRPRRRAPARSRSSTARPRSSSAIASSSTASCAPPARDRLIGAVMSSHREAPEISKDPVADSTDVYAFVSPDRPDTVTHHHELHPARGSRRRPELLRVRRRRPLPHQHRQRQRRQARARSTSSRSRPATRTRRRSSTTPARSTASTARTSTAARPTTCTRSATAGAGGSASGLLAPPCNVGIRSTPNYAGARRRRRSTTSATASRVFAGQRLDGFFVDLGSVFDLAALRPFQHLHLIPTPAGARRQRAAVVQRAHARDPGPDHASSPPTARRRRTRWRPTPRSASGRRRRAARRRCATASGSSASVRTCR